MHAAQTPRAHAFAGVETAADLSVEVDKGFIYVRVPGRYKLVSTSSTTTRSRLALAWGLFCSTGLFSRFDHSPRKRVQTLTRARDCGRFCA